MMIHVAVIGLGYWGPNLARNFHELPEAELCELCDSDRTRLQEMEKRFPQARLSQNHLFVLNNPEIEAVAIATPAVTHYALVREALEHDKHVLVEKPLSLSTAEAEELVALAHGCGKVLMVDHTFEYHPAVELIKQLIRDGELGRIHYILSQRLNLGIVRQDVNALWNLAPHDISIILRLLGEEPMEVEAFGGTFLQEKIEDVVFLSLGFPSGAIAQIHVSWLDPRKVRQVTVVGSRKMVVFDDTVSEERVKIYNKGIDRQESYESYGEYFTMRFGDVVAPRIPGHEPLRLACTDFLRAIREGTSPRSDGEVGLRVVRVLEAADAALARRRQ